MQPRSAHTIDFASLNDGSHSFSFALKDDFFLGCGVEEFLGGEAWVDVTLEKSAEMLVVLIRATGTVTMPCNRCDTPMHQHVEGQQRQVFVFSDEDDGDGFELVVLEPGTREVNLTHYIYECIRLHLPLRHVHPEGECDPVVMAILNRISVDRGPDPRWAKLQDLKNKGA